MSEFIHKSNKLANVCYDIRGPVVAHAKKMEDEGQRIIKLNIGNIAAFGLEPPEEIVQDVLRNIHLASGYSDSKGLFAARKAVMHYAQSCQIQGVEIDDIYLGNGVSELISTATMALLNSGDEVLIPAPDYPLWTAATTLAGGVARHYRCDPDNHWLPNLDALRALITPRTKALVVINPNNPTGALYPRETLLALVEIARQHRLVILADEVYDKMLYDDAQHIPIASLADDVLCVSMNGLSKNYRACGFRSAWMIVSGPKHLAKDYMTGLTMLASMRLCPNVMGQLAIQTALGGYQSIDDLVGPNGRLTRQRDYAYQRLSAMEGVSCTKPQAALYIFPRLDPQVYPIANDQLFAYHLLAQEKLLIVQGTGFNWLDHAHFRLVFLPNLDDLKEALDRLERFLQRLRSGQQLLTPIDPTAFN